MRGILCRSITTEELEQWCGLGLQGKTQLRQAVAIWRQLWREGSSCPADCWWVCEGRRPLMRAALMHEGDTFQRLVDLWFDPRGPWYRTVQELLTKLLETRPWKDVLWELGDQTHTDQRLIALAQSLGFEQRGERCELLLALNSNVPARQSELKIGKLSVADSELASCGIDLEEADRVRTLKLRSQDHPACCLRLDGLGGGELFPAAELWDEEALTTLLVALAGQLPQMGVENLLLAPPRHWKLPGTCNNLYASLREAAYLRFVRAITVATPEK